MDDAPPPKPNYYYPLYTSSRTIGTCSNNGNEPRQYHDRVQNNFLFDSMNECCEQWYHDAGGCKEGFAYPDEANNDGELLLRNWVTGELFESYGGYGIPKEDPAKEEVDGGRGGRDRGERRRGGSAGALPRRLPRPTTPISTAVPSPGITHWIRGPIICSPPKRRLSRVVFGRGRLHGRLFWWQCHHHLFH